MSMVERVARKLAEMNNDGCFDSKLGGMASEHHLCVYYETAARVAIEAVIEQLDDHYWDSLAEHKELILKHVRGALLSPHSDGGAA